MQVVENMHVCIYKYLSLKNRLKARGITVSFRDYIRMCCYFSDLISFCKERISKYLEKKIMYKGVRVENKTKL